LIWLLAGAVVLGLDPWALLQPGFWLSFVAVGVLMASDRQGTQDRVLQPLQALWRGAWGLLREQATITLALAPLTLLFFGQVSVVGLLANMLAIPWVTLVVTPLAMLGVVWSGAWVWAVWALQPMTAWLGWLAALPLSSVSTAMPPWGFAVLALAGALGLVLRLPLAWKLVCLPLLWPVLFWTSPRPAPGSFDVLAADVGQGNAVLVRTATHSLLYDTGPRYSAESDAGHRVLVPLLAQMGERIDLLMLSHRDSDHTGGAAAVLAMQPQASLWSSLEDDHVLHGLRPGWTRCQTGQSWLWDGVLFEVLHPPAIAFEQPLPLAPKRLQTNALSCVLRIRSAGVAGVAGGGHVSALLAGDIEAAQELALVQSGLSPVDLLLVPHHGSKTSSTVPFLQALQPRLALVQAGYRNRYGHPAEPVLARYREQGIALVESSRCGAAIWRSDAPGQVQCEREQSRRYWHHVMTP
jgi:competence protein ComEC